MSKSFKQTVEQWSIIELKPIKLIVFWKMIFYNNKERNETPKINKTLCEIILNYLLDVKFYENGENIIFYGTRTWKWTNWNVNL